MKKWFNIEYFDRYGTTRITKLKARNEDDAEKRFYKQYKYSLIKKISLIDK